MSILVILVVREGLLFGADRNLTVTTASGQSVGQFQRTKVLKWPNRDILVGYVGRAEVAPGQYTDQWLEDFIARNPNTDLPQLAHDLRDALQSDLRGRIDKEPMIVHLGGFVKDAGQSKPQVWYIHNTEAPYENPRPAFDVSEEIDSPNKFPGCTGNQIRAQVDQMAHQWNPFWFRQAIGLFTFGVLYEVLRFGMQALMRNGHPFPDSLEEWSKHLSFSILSYAAYFAAFRPPNDLTDHPDRPHHKTQPYSP